MGVMGNVGLRVRMEGRGEGDAMEERCKGAEGEKGIDGGRKRGRERRSAREHGREYERKGRLKVGKSRWVGR